MKPIINLLLLSLCLSTASHAQDRSIRDQLRDAKDHLKEAAQDAAGAARRATDKAIDQGKDVAEVVERGAKRHYYASQAAWYDAKAYLREEASHYRIGVTDHFLLLGEELRLLKADLRDVEQDIPPYFITRIQALNEQHAAIQARLESFTDEQLRDLEAGERPRFNAALYHFENALNQAQSEGATWIRK